MIKREGAGAQPTQWKLVKVRSPRRFAEAKVYRGSRCTVERSRLRKWEVGSIQVPTVIIRMFWGESSVAVTLCLPRAMISSVEIEINSIVT